MVKLYYSLVSTRSPSNKGVERESSLSAWFKYVGDFPSAQTLDAVYAVRDDIGKVSGSVSDTTYVVDLFEWKGAVTHPADISGWLHRNNCEKVVTMSLVNFPDVIRLQEPTALAFLLKEYKSAQKDYATLYALGQKIYPHRTVDVSEALRALLEEVTLLFIELQESQSRPVLPIDRQVRYVSFEGTEYKSVTYGEKHLSVLRTLMRLPKAKLPELGEAVAEALVVRNAPIVRDSPKNGFIGTQILW